MSAPNPAPVSGPDCVLEDLKRAGASWGDTQGLRQLLRETYGISRTAVVRDFSRAIIDAIMERSKTQPATMVEVYNALQEAAMQLAITHEAGHQRGPRIALLLVPTPPADGETPP